MEIRGNILDHEYRINVEGEQIAEISKKWFHIQMPMEHPDAYGVKIEPGQDNALIMAITTALDQMAHEK